METSNTYLDGLKQKLMPYLKDYLEEHNIKVSAQGKFRCINPEHKDDNPSSSFHPDSKEQIFNCFSCGAKGTIVDAAHFLEGKPTTGREFIYENLFYLADKYNIPYNDKFEVTEEEIYRSEVFKAYAEASDIISENQPIEYLQKRKWPVSLCREYGVGCVKSYEDFMTRLSNRGFTKEFLQDIDFNNQLYAPNMLLFEIRNERGKIVGFAGRDMNFKKGSKTFKFRNTSSKCPIYHKSKILYGLYAAKKSCPPLYIFEGYPDWLTAQKHGLLNSCAIGGTALTYEHINLIKELNIRDIILCLDGDPSGQDKTEKLLDEHFSGEEALRIKIVKMPSDTAECDPDDYLDKHGLDAFRNLPLMDAFEWRLSRFPYDFDKEDVCDRMIPLIVNEPNNIRREGMCKHLSEFAGVRLKAIQRQLDSILNYEEAHIKEKENAIENKVISGIRERDADAVAIFEEALEDIRKLRSTNSDEVHSSDELMTYMTDVREKFEERKAGLLGFKTGWDIFDDAFSGIPREDNMITFAGDSNLGKCKKFDSPVLLSDGSYDTIENICKNKVHGIMTMNNHKIVPSKVSNWIDSGELICFKLKTKSGLVDESSETHPYYTIDGWKHIKDLQVGDKIAVPKRYNIENEDVIGRWKAVLLGLLLSDGAITKSVSFCNTDEQLIDLFKNIIVENFGEDYGFRKEKERCTISASRKGSTKNEIIDLLKDFGVYGKNSHTKFIPSEIFKSSDELIGDFLGAFYACDGWVCKGTAGVGLGIGVSLCNESMIKQIHSLLLRLGIKTRISSSFSKCNGKVFNRFSINILDKENVLRFHNKVKIPLDYKQDLLDNFYCSEETHQRGSYKLNLPSELWNRVKSVCVKNEVEFSELLSAVCSPIKYFSKSRNKHRIKKYNINLKHNINPVLLKKIAYRLNDDFLMSLSNGDIMFDDIVSIENIGKHQCYDLTVPVTHNFIANDIVVHNTGFMFNLSHRIAKYNEDACVLFMSIDDSRQQAIPRLVSISSGLEIRQVTHPTEHIHSDEDKKKLDDGWRDITSMMAEGRFAIKDVSHGVDLNFAENWIRYMQDKYPEKQVIFFLDNFHKLSDESAKDERIRFKHASGRIHAMKNRLHITAICTMELRKFLGVNGSKRPVLSDIAECVTGDTLLTDGYSGLQIPIKDIEIGRRVLSMIKPGVAGPARVINKFYKGKNRVYNVMMRSGRSIRATENHPFFTPEGWVSLRDLEPGHSTAVPSGGNFVRSLVYSNDLCRFLGYMAGDGTYGKHRSIGFINKDNDIVNDVIDIVKQNFKGIKISERDSHGSRDLRFTIPKKEFIPGQNPIRKWMNSMDISPSIDKNKTVPNFIFECSEEPILNYISGLIATDGTITRAGGRYYRIQISSISRRLLIGAQTLLCKIGVKSTVSFAGYDSEKSTSSIFVLSVESASCIDLCEKINIRGDKDLRVKSVLQETRNNTNPGSSVLPIEFTRRVEKKRVEKGLPRLFDNGYISQGKRMKYSTARYVAEQLDDDFLKTWSNSDFMWDEIVSIVSVGVEDVFDIEVEGCHNFVANGIVIHNSKQMEYDNNMIGMLYNDIHARRDAAEAIWIEEKDGVVVKKPIVEIDIQKNKITDFKGTLYYKFSPEHSLFYECNSSEAGELKATYKAALKSMSDKRNPSKPKSGFISSSEVDPW